MQNLALAADEQIIQEAKFIWNGGFSYLTYKTIKADVVVTTRRFVKQSRTYILGIIPAGTDNLTFPLSSISSVGCMTRVNWINLILGIILALTIFAGSILTALVGAVLIFFSFYAAITVTNHSGQNVYIRVSSRNKALAFAESMNATLAGAHG